MTGRKGKIIWFLYACMLVVLFLLSSTDLIIKERKKEVYSISLIIEDARDDNYVNFRKGVDRAAVEMNADVSFITLYNAGNNQQQMNLILREQQDGAQALIVSPISETEVVAAMEDGRIHKPIVFVNSDLTGGKAAAAISPDYHDMGVLLVREVVKEQQQGAPIYLFSGETASEMTERFQAGISSALNEKGYEYEVFSGQEEQGFQEKIEEAVGLGQKDLVIIALDQETLTEMAAILSEHRIHASYVSGLYGRGSTIPILNYLDKEVVAGICAVDDFSAGYLSVKAAIEAAASKSYYGSVQLDSYYIRKEDLSNPEYEKKLYPVE